MNKITDVFSLKKTDTIVDEDGHVAQSWQVTPGHQYPLVIDWGDIVTSHLPDGSNSQTFKTKIYTL